MYTGDVSAPPVQHLTRPFMSTEDFVSDLGNGIYVVCSDRYEQCRRVCCRDSMAALVQQIM